MSDYYLATAKMILKISGVIPIPEHNLPLFLRDYHLVINYGQMTIMTSSLLIYSASASYFIIFDMTTLNEFSEAVYYLIATLVEMTLYLTLLSKRSKIISFMKELEEMIKRSMLKIIFILF